MLHYGFGASARRKGLAKPAVYGRMLFGASAALFGVIALLWHDADTWQQLVSLWQLPSGLIIGECLMAAQVAGAIGLLDPRTARVSAMLLCAVFCCTALASVPAIVAAPRSYQGYGSFFEQFCLLCGAASAAGRNARFGLGLCAASFAVEQFVYLHGTVSLVPAWIPPDRMFWAILTTIAFALAALAILANVRARLALRSMAAMVGLFGILVWIPMLVAHPASHGDWSEFALTMAIAGAAWIGAYVL